MKVLMPSARGALRPDPLLPGLRWLSWAALALLSSGHCGPVSAATGHESQPEVSAAVTVPLLMHAKAWSSGDDPRAYLVSEKLDGVRAYWDGRSLRFRSGLPIAAPAWFVAGLPETPLDGELWLGRGRFDELSAMVRSSVPRDADWRAVRYMIFDLPGDSGRFAERVQRMLRLVEAAQLPWLQAVEQHAGLDALALQKRLKLTVQAGGEGLMLHQAQALWSPGRSDVLRKFKPLLDAEARVVAHLPGKGRHQGRLGALLLEMPDGQRFALGTGFSDAQRADPPALGAIVTYRYRDRTPRGLPRFASFWRVQAW